MDRTLGGTPRPPGTPQTPVDKLKRFEQLKTELGRLEQTFVAHNAVPGHPDFCVQQSIQIKVWDCLLGSPEAPANVWVDWTASLDRAKVLKALRMAVKRMEYDSKLDEFFRLREEARAAPAQEASQGSGIAAQPGNGRKGGDEHEDPMVAEQE